MRKKREWWKEFPEIYKEWDNDKNNRLESCILRDKVWWKCLHGHCWETAIYSRISKQTKCPYCIGKKAGNLNNFLVKHPILAKEWDYAENKDIEPEQFLPHSHKKVWWRCKKGHNWEARIDSRVSGNGCPFCTGRIATDDNNLSAYPHLIKEWNKSKNRHLSPVNFTHGSGKKVWWRCKKGHQWKAEIKARVRGNGCPKCCKQFSYLELRVYTELKKSFKNVSWRGKIEGSECDILLNDYNLGIEVDGYYYHKDKYQKEISKNDLFIKNGIKLIRVREKPLKVIDKELDIFYSSKDIQKDILNKLYAKI